MVDVPNDPGYDADAVPLGPGVSLNRRTLLGTATGGFVLAAGGLLLPERLVAEAAGDDHPVRRIQGRKEGQRGRRRLRLAHRREQDRRHGNDKDRDTSPGGDIYKGITFRFDVSGGRPVFVKIYDYDGGWFSLPFDSHQGTFAPGSSHTFQTGDRLAALRIDQNLWIKAENPLLPWENPVLWSGYGGSFTIDDGYGSGTFVAKSVLGVGNWSYKLERDGYSIQAQRLADDDAGYHKVFSVKIVSPNP